MYANKFPRLIIDHKLLKDNVKKVCKLCNDNGIKVAGIVKGANGIKSIIKDYEEGGVDIIGSSRLAHLKRAIEAGVNLPMMLIRIPMMSEIPDVINIADISLNSEEKVIKALNIAAISAKKNHKIILMADLGDLREGFWNYTELVKLAEKIEFEMEGLNLAGIGTNLGCYGSVMPTEDKMEQLIHLSERIENKIGRKLEYVSGGATSSLMNIFENTMPEGINMLRIGALPLAGSNEELAIVYGYKEDLKCFSGEAIILEAEVIEIKEKPSYPVGKLGVNAMGVKCEYEDIGIRKRAILAIGRADYGSIDDLIIEDTKSKIIGASGDHTIIDITESDIKYEIGDIMRFRLRYSAILNLTQSEDVAIFERSN